MWQREQWQAGKAGIQWDNSEACLSALHSAPRDTRCYATIRVRVGIRHPSLIVVIYLLSTRPRLSMCLYTLPHSVFSLLKPLPPSKHYFHPFHLPTHSQSLPLPQDVKVLNKKTNTQTKIQIIIIITFLKLKFQRPEFCAGKSRGHKHFWGCFDDTTTRAVFFLLDINTGRRLRLRDGKGGRMREH